MFLLCFLLSRFYQTLNFADFFLFFFFLFYFLSAVLFAANKINKNFLQGHHLLFTAFLQPFCTTCTRLYCPWRRAQLESFFSDDLPPTLHPLQTCSDLICISLRLSLKTCLTALHDASVKCTADNAS